MRASAAPAGRVAQPALESPVVRLEVAAKRGLELGIERQAGAGVVLLEHRVPEVRQAEEAQHLVVRRLGLGEEVARCRRRGSAPRPTSASSRSRWSTYSPRVTVGVVLVGEAVVVRVGGHPLRLAGAAAPAPARSARSNALGLEAAGQLVGVRASRPARPGRGRSTSSFTPGRSRAIRCAGQRVVHVVRARLEGQRRQPYRSLDAPAPARQSGKCARYQLIAAGRSRCRSSARPCAAPACSTAGCWLSARYSDVVPQRCAPQIRNDGVHPRAAGEPRRAATDARCTMRLRRGEHRVPSLLHSAATRRISAGQQPAADDAQPGTGLRLAIGR